MALLAWTFLPDETGTALLLIAAGIANAVRLARWKGWLTHQEQLVLVLHVAFACIPLGLMAVGAAILWPDAIPQTGALHVLTAGAIGLMTLAMMTRVSLGHTGGVLSADIWIKLIYWSLGASVLLRFAYGYVPENSVLHLSAGLWILAFVLFVLRYSYMARSLNDPDFGVSGKAS